MDWNVRETEKAEERMGGILARVKCFLFFKRRKKTENKKQKRIVKLPLFVFSLNGRKQWERWNVQHSSGYYGSRRYPMGIPGIHKTLRSVRPTRRYHMNNSPVHHCVATVYTTRVASHKQDRAEQNYYRICCASIYASSCKQFPSRADRWFSSSQKHLLSSLLFYFSFFFSTAETKFETHRQVSRQDR
jgi:hypothetical protein